MIEQGQGLKRYPGARSIPLWLRLRGRLCVFFLFEEKESRTKIAQAFHRSLFVMPPPFHTEFAGYAVEFSPFEENRLAVATAQHFGIIGNGRQYVLETLPGGKGWGEPRFFETQDNIYDCSWSEDNDAHLVSACGDGSIKVGKCAFPQ